MKKYLAVLLSIILILVSVAGCGGGSTDKSSTTDSKPSTADSKASTQNTVSKAEYTFKIHQNDPATSATGLMLEAWADKVRKASNGRIDFKVYHGGTLGGVSDSYDILSNGVADLAWINTAYFPGNFPLTEAGLLPMRGIKNATQGSHTIWDLYKQYKEIQNEYSNFHVIAVHGNCSSPISTKNKKITEVSQLSGLKIRGNSGPPTKFVQNLGSAAVSVKITELFEAIKNNTIDAVITDWHAIKSFALYETCKYYLDENIGVSIFFFGMNKNSYNKLPDDLKACIDKNSGDALIEYVGNYWNDAEAECRKLAVEKNGGEIYKLSDSERSKLQGIADKTVQDWIAAKKAAGVSNASEIVNSMSELVKKYDSGK